MARGVSRKKAAETTKAGRVAATDFRFVSCAISQRAGGLILLVSFGAESDAQRRGVNIGRLSSELRATLQMVQERALRGRALFSSPPDELLALRHVLITGRSEPTLCANFAEAVQAIVHTRAQGAFPFFKVVLQTNASALDLPCVQRGLGFLSSQDDIWASLAAGTQHYVEKCARAPVRLDQVVGNILEIARARPVTIQSMFARIDGEAPPVPEIEAYAHRLRTLVERGASIPMVHIFSDHHRGAGRGHLPLKALCGIARVVREVSGLRAEVF